MAIRFKFLGILLFSFLIFYCSEPELINPNHPGSSEYVSTSTSDINKLVLDKRPGGIQLSIFGSEAGIEEWIVRPHIRAGDALVWQEREIRIPSNGDSILTQLDTLAEWEQRISYISYAKNVAGISRGIDTVTIDYKFVKPVCEFSAESDDDSNSFEIIVIPDNSDKYLVTALQFQQTVQRISADIDEYTPDMDTIRIYVSGFNWPDNFNYSLKLVGGNHLSEDLGGWFEILPPSMNGMARFLGAGGMNLHLTPNLIAGMLPITGMDSVRLNWDLPTSYTIRIDDGIVDTLSKTVDIIGKDSIAILDWSKDQLDYITIQGLSSIWSKEFEDTLAIGIDIPGELSDMSFIPDDEEAAINGFYMDIYEASYAKAIGWMVDVNTSHLLDAIQTSYAQLLTEYTQKLIPAIAIDQSMLMSLPESRSLPTLAQWRKAGTGSGEGTGLPLVGYTYAEPEICNYSNSGDNFEISHPYLPLVPIDFFSADRENSTYEVHNNSPAISSSPYGINQMCGNMAEWVTTDDLNDHVLVGGSFWSAIDDTLLNVEYSATPFDGEPVREYWGFRTVINAADSSRYLVKNIQLR